MPAILYLASIARMHMEGGSTAVESGDDSPHSMVLPAWAASGILATMTGVGGER